MTITISSLRQYADLDEEKRVVDDLAGLFKLIDMNSNTDELVDFELQVKLSTTLYPSINGYSEEIEDRFEDANDAYQDLLDILKNNKTSKLQKAKAEFIKTILPEPPDWLITLPSDKVMAASYCHATERESRDTANTKMLQKAVEGFGNGEYFVSGLRSEKYYTTLCFTESGDRGFRTFVLGSKPNVKPSSEDTSK